LTALRGIFSDSRLQGYISFPLLRYIGLLERDRIGGNGNRPFLQLLEEEPSY